MSNSLQPIKITGVILGVSPHAAFSCLPCREGFKTRKSFLRHVTQIHAGEVDDVEKRKIRRVCRLVQPETVTIKELREGGRL